jgi:hypothetical protein
MPVTWLAVPCFPAIVRMVLRVFLGMICSWTGHLRQVSMGSRNHYLIAISDIMFLVRLECSFLSLIMTFVIGYTLPSWVCFTDFHLCYKLFDVVDGRNYFLKHFLSFGIVFLSSGLTVLNILNWTTTLLLQ